MSTEAQREAFEAWARDYGYQRDELDRCRIGIVGPAYYNANTETAWQAWQAAQQAALLSVPQWRDIETAPKDGTVVLIGRHMGNFGFVRGYGHFDGKPGAFLSGWISAGFDPVMSNLGLAHPTHWMPLPTPPQPTEKGEQP